MAGIELDLVQTLTRKEVMEAREEDAKEIRSAGSKAKSVNQRIVKGYNVA